MLELELGGFELSFVFWELNLCPFQEQPMILTSVTSLQPCRVFVCFKAGQSYASKDLSYFHVVVYLSAT